MTKPRLVKVRALFYVFQYITKQRGCANFDTASFFEKHNLTSGTFCKESARRMRECQNVHVALKGLNKTAQGLAPVEGR